MFISLALFSDNSFFLRGGAGFQFCFFYCSGFCIFRQQFLEHALDVVFPWKPCVCFLGLPCAVRAFPHCSEQEAALVSLCGLLAAWRLLLWSTGYGAQASAAAARGLSSCGPLAQLLHSMWTLPGPGIKPMSPALAGKYLSTAPPRKSWKPFFKVLASLVLGGARKFQT